MFNCYPPLWPHSVMSTGPIRWSMTCWRPLQCTSQMEPMICGAFTHNIIPKDIHWFHSSADKSTTKAHNNRQCHFFTAARANTDVYAHIPALVKNNLPIPDIFPARETLFRFIGLAYIIKSITTELISSVTKRNSQVFNKFIKSSYPRDTEYYYNVNPYFTLQARQIICQQLWKWITFTLMGERQHQ